MSLDTASSIAVGDGWLMEVRGDGEWIRFRDDAYINGAENTPVPMDARPPVDSLDARGREVMKNELAPFIALGEQEELRGWLVSRLTNTLMNGDGSERSEVVASRIIYTRVINGIPVLGPGGKVSVILANDGALVGFDIDWPELKPIGESVRTADLATVQSRADTLLGVLAGQERPVARVFECGLYDPGVAAAMGEGRIGPACVAILDLDSGISRRIVVPLEAP